jgi:comEA protein
MEPFKFLQEYGFTKNEIRFVLILAVTFVAGLLVRHFTESQRPTGNGFDYSVADSVFRERSKVPVPSTQEANKPKTRLAPNTRVNINTASKNDLMQLPGIGEAYAERIIIHRTDHGPYKTIDDLERVKGIGKKRLEQLRPYLVVQ